MRILGIDPGTSLIGYGIIDSMPRKMEAVDYGAIRGPANIPTRERVVDVYDRVTAIIKQHRPDIVALETLFFFKNVLMNDIVRNFFENLLRNFF